MAQINKIMDSDLLQSMIEQGYIRERRHPELDELRILNYAEKTQFESMWNEATLNARGLIYNVQTGEVLARPFKKFFNYGQTGAPTLDLDSPIFGAWDKADGSLGILYNVTGEDYEHTDAYGLNVATRGSFESDQAKWATAFVRRKWEGLYDDACQMIEGGYTPLVEIIYPENRIVLNYAGAETLKHLGYVDMATGAYTGIPDFNPLLSAIDVADQAIATTVREVLELPNRKNAEGYVIWMDALTAVKVKQEDYVELHRIVTGLNRKSVWRSLRENTYGTLLEQVPDELHTWVRSVQSELDAEYVRIWGEAMHYYMPISDDLEQREFALEVQKTVPKEFQPLCFAWRAGKVVSDMIWKRLEPVGGTR